MKLIVVLLLLTVMSQHLILTVPSSQTLQVFLVKIPDIGNSKLQCDYSEVEYVIVNEVSSQI